MISSNLGLDHQFFRTRNFQVFFVFNGTAANVLALRFLAERHQSVLCSDISHLNIDECGAPEFFVGKLIPIKHSQGKISLSQLKEALIRRGDQHYSQIKVISLTQPTELGTCYSLNELKEITDWAHQNQLYVHLDGARLSNALIELKCTFKEMTTDLNIDIVSFGGTKNGLMMGEAILVLNPELSQSSKQKLKYLRKQSAQLPSKTRFIAAQFSKYLENNLYHEIAGHSCAM
ncbi:MAG: beta-eliminating lyase-related protein, partial [Bdellovibrionales bacterium]